MSDAQNRNSETYAFAYIIDERYIETVLRQLFEEQITSMGMSRRTHWLMIQGAPDDRVSTQLKIQERTLIYPHERRFQCQTC